MKTIDILHCSIGHFNWANSSEKSLHFSLGIKENNKIIERDGIKCILYIIKYDDLEYYRDYFQELVTTEEYLDLINLGLEYGNSVLSSTDYIAQCFAFAGEYINSFEEIEKSMIKRNEDDLKKEIKQLEDRLVQLRKTKIYFTDLREDIKDGIEEGLKKYKNWIELNNEEIKQLKKDSDKRKLLEDDNKKYKDKIKGYLSLLN
jgi:hypothetical protein